MGAAWALAAGVAVGVAVGVVVGMSPVVGVAAEEEEEAAV